MSDQLSHSFPSQVSDYRTDIPENLVFPWLPDPSHWINRPKRLVQTTCIRWAVQQLRSKHPNPRRPRSLDECNDPRSLTADVISEACRACCAIFKIILKRVIIVQMFLPAPHLVLDFSSDGNRANQWE
jgi:hypothetical protein